MKSIILTMTLSACVFTVATAQRREAIKQPIKEVQVTADAVSRQRTVLNLTTKGTIYSLPAGIDYSRVVVRTSKGETTVAELIKKSGKQISGKLRVAMTDDIRAQKVGIRRGSGRTGGLNYDCSALACACTGDDDCNDLFTTSKCGPIAICYPDGCICIRI
jgi:hypothetical protein